MSRIFATFLAFLRAQIAVMLQYRVEILLWSAWGLINPAVLYAMWSSASASQPSQSIAGFDRSQFAAYFFAVMIVGHVTAAWDAYEMGYQVRSGQMSAKLLRPILPIWQDIADNMAYKITTLVYVIPGWILFAWMIKPTFTTHAWQVSLGLVALVIAAVLNYILGYCIALVAFWSPRLDAVAEVYFGMGMFLGGKAAPLAALPTVLQKIAYALPFKWMFSFPVEMVLGRVARPNDALQGICIQLVWLGLSVAAFRKIWASAVKRYTAVSG